MHGVDTRHALRQYAPLKEICLARGVFASHARCRASEERAAARVIADRRDPLADIEALGG